MRTSTFPSPYLLNGYSGNEAGDVGLGVFTTKDINIGTFTNLVVVTGATYPTHEKKP